MDHEMGAVPSGATQLELGMVPLPNGAGDAVAVAVAVTGQMVVNDFTLLVTHMVDSPAELVPLKVCVTVL